MSKLIGKFFNLTTEGTYVVEITVPAGYTAVSPTAPTVNIAHCSAVQQDFELALAPTPTSTATPTATNTATQIAFRLVARDRSAGDSSFI